MPLGSPTLTQPAVMWNLMGDLWPTDPNIHTPDWTPILKTEGAKLHLYGKTQARPGRKMGHVTFLAGDLEDAILRASACRKSFGLPAIEQPA